MQGLLGQEDRLTALLDARRQSRQIGHSHGTTLAKCACACNARHGMLHRCCFWMKERDDGSEGELQRQIH
jgi:hypothetical protein